MSQVEISQPIATSATAPTHANACRLSGADGEGEDEEAEGEVGGVLGERAGRPRRGEPGELAAVDGQVVDAVPGRLDRDGGEREREAEDREHGVRAERRA